MDLGRPLHEITATEIARVVEQDWARNFRDSSTPDRLLKMLRLWMITGGAAGYRNGVIFMGRPLSRTAMEFHSINGTSVRQLLRSTQELLQALKQQGFQEATTNFTSPRVRDMAKHLTFPCHLTPTTATFSLED